MAGAKREGKGGKKKEGSENWQTKKVPKKSLPDGVGQLQTSRGGKKRLSKESPSKGSVEKRPNQDGCKKEEEEDPTGRRWGESAK